MKGPESLPEAGLTCSCEQYMDMSAGIPTQSSYLSSKRCNSVTAEPLPQPQMLASWFKLQVSFAKQHPHTHTRHVFLIGEGEGTGGEEEEMLLLKTTGESLHFKKVRNPGYKTS